MIVMTSPHQVDGSPDDQTAAVRPGEALTADLNPERRLPALSVACCDVKVCSSPKRMPPPPAPLRPATPIPHYPLLSLTLTAELPVAGAG